MIAFNVNTLIIILNCLTYSVFALTQQLPARDVRTGTGAVQYDPSVQEAGIAPTQLDRSGWTVTADSFQPGCEPENVLDGTGSTWWESAFIPTITPLPHNITIDMKNQYVINGFRMLPRQDGSHSGNIGQHQIEFSLDGRAWGRIAYGTYANDQAAKTTFIQNTLARYVRLIAYTTAEGKGYQYVTVGEIDLLSRPDPALPRENWQVTADSENPLPNQHRAVDAIDGPSTTYWSTQFNGSSPDFPHTFTINLGSPQAVSGLSYLGPPTADGRIGRFNIQQSTDGSTWNNVTSGNWTDDANPKSVEFSVITVRYIRLIALSEAGNRGPWAAASEINLFDGNRQATDFVVTVDSEETNSTDEDGHAINALDGDPATFWTTQRATPKPPNYPHYFKIDMQASYAVHGLSYLPRQTPGNLQGNIGQNLIEISVDGTSWTPVARGTWEDDQLVKVSEWRALTARYLRLTALSEAGNRGPWASAAEIKPLIQSTYMAPAPESAGQWGETIAFPLVPVAAALIPATGEVLVWSAWNADQYADGDGRTVTAIFSPATGLVTQSVVTNTGHDMFCPGISLTADGLIVVAGGHNAEKTSIYHPNTHTWSPGPNLTLPRGYNSQVTLSDNTIFTIGGSWNGALGDKTAELFNPTTQTWSLLSSCPADPILTADRAGIYRQDNHAWLFAWKNASVFQAGPSRNTNWFSTDGEGSTAPAGPRGNDPDAMNGNAVMYDAVAGKILTVGGAINYDDSYTSSNANIITLGDPFTPPTVTTIGNAHYARAYQNSVVLPNGQVFIVGGTNYARVFTDDTSILYPELFSPSDNSFTVMAPMSIPRNYHSVALLLPDGTVFCGGGGLCGANCSANHPDAQIFRPPYLFNYDQSVAIRPKILGAEQREDWRVGARASVTVDGAMGEGGGFALVRFGSSTHSVDTDQRRVPLDFTSAGGEGEGEGGGEADGARVYRVQIPEDPGIVVPGWWMLFAINGAGVPSVARIVNIQLG